MIPFCLASSLSPSSCCQKAGIPFALEGCGPLRARAPMVAALRGFSRLEPAGQPPALPHTLSIKRWYLAPVSCWESHFGLVVLQQLISAWPCSPPAEVAAWLSPVTAHSEGPSHLGGNPRFSPRKVVPSKQHNSFWQQLPALACLSAAEIRVEPQSWCLFSCSSLRKVRAGLPLLTEVSFCGHSSVPFFLASVSAASISFASQPVVPLDSESQPPLAH